MLSFVLYIAAMVPAFDAQPTQVDLGVHRAAVEVAGSCEGEAGIEAYDVATERAWAKAERSARLRGCSDLVALAPTVQMSSNEGPMGCGQRFSAQFTCRGALYAQR